MGIENIEHVVVVMFENRSFDNLLGWLYDNASNPPKFNIPAQDPPTFDGLQANTYYNSLNGTQYQVVRGTTAALCCPNRNQVPTPDPQEEFVHVTEQLFGTQTPAAGQTADMSGFLQDYSTTSAGTASATQIVQTYGPEQANVINGLARNFAVCDRWFASVPTQTWPNRGFVHTGSSDGHINNDNYEWYDIPTIYNILQAQGKSWNVFHDSELIPSLTLWQFPQAGSMRGNFKSYGEFKNCCAAAANADPATKLPAYSFVEPRFVAELFVAQPSDYHPPHNICRGETFLADMYQAVRNSPYRDKIMLIVTFDEHGGCYDHVPPPTGAAAPQPSPRSRDNSFGFDRFGVRVPAIVISSYVEPGTVFRAANSEAPYDHTSILATVRDWPFLGLNKANFLPSPRIAAAPTLDRVLTRAAGNENTNWPDVQPQCTIDGSDVSQDTPLNDLQKSLLAGAKALNTDTPPAVAAQQAKQLVTYQHGGEFMQPFATGN